MRQGGIGISLESALSRPQLDVNVPTYAICGFLLMEHSFVQV